MNVMVSEPRNGPGAGQQDAAADAGKPRGPEGVRRMLRSLNNLRQAWLRKIEPATDRT